MRVAAAFFALLIHKGIAIDTREDVESYVIFSMAIFQYFSRYCGLGAKAVGFLTALISCAVCCCDNKFLAKPNFHEDQ